MLSQATHWHHYRIDAFFFKIRVVDERRFKTVRGMANVGDQLGLAVDVHWVITRSVVALNRAKLCSKAALGPHWRWAHDLL